MTPDQKHERRVVGHASGWHEQMNTCICGKRWPCPEAPPSNEQSQPADRFRKVRSNVPWNLLPCRFCGSPAELWQRWERDDIWCSFGACTNLEDVDGEACLFHLPDSPHFYRDRKMDAVRYWNLMMGSRSPVETSPPRIGPIEPDNASVICPHCTSQFRAIPVNVQNQLREMGKAGDDLAHQYVYTSFHERWWQARGGHDACTVCVPDSAPETPPNAARCPIHKDEICTCMPPGANGYRTSVKASSKCGHGNDPDKCPHPHTDTV